MLVRSSIPKDGIRPVNNSKTSQTAQKYLREKLPSCHSLLKFFQLISGNRAGNKPKSHMSYLIPQKNAGRDQKVKLQNPNSRNKNKPPPNRNTSNRNVLISVCFPELDIYLVKVQPWTLLFSLHCFQYYSVRESP